MRSEIEAPAAGWRALLVALLLLLACWALALERSYAYLGLQSRVSEAQIARGLHPLSVNFALSYASGWDWRRQLVGWQQPAAQFENSASGLHVLPHVSTLDLRFPFGGAVIDSHSVKALRVHFDRAGAAPNHSALAVHADANDAGWIAELPADLSTDIDLSTLVFAREPVRVQTRRWHELPKIGLVRLYLNLQPKQTLIFQQLGFVNSKDSVVTNTLSTLWPPSLLNNFEAMRQAGASWPVVRYHGLWLGQKTLGRVAAALALLACLSHLLLWRQGTKPGTVAALSMILSFAPALLTLYFDSSLGAELWLLALAAVPIFSWLLVRHLLLPSAISLPQRVGQAESLRQALLISLSIASVAVIGFFGLGQGIDPLYFDARTALSYLLFAALQQFLLQKVVLDALEQTRLSRALVVVFSASIFALWHVPNLLLMGVCFVVALLWCSHFLRFRSLSTLIFSHALLGWLLSVLFPQQWLRSAKIGVMYFW